MRSRLAWATLVAGIALTAARAGAQAKGSKAELDSYEAMVAWSLHQANQEQLEMAKLGSAKGSSDAVKSFAQRLGEEHGAADTQVQAYAERRGLDLGALASRVDSMSKDQLELERRVRGVGSATGEWIWSWEQAERAKRTTPAELESLRRRKTGTEFDREFARVALVQHRDITDRLAEARGRTGDPELRSLVDGILPACKQHLATAQQLQTRVSKAE